MNYQIEPMQESDWPAVKRIYAYGIKTGLANFYEHAPAWPSWNANYLDFGRLVARDRSRKVLGWAALSPVGGN